MITCRWRCEIDPSVGSIRALALDLRSWNSSGTSWNTRFLRALNHAKDAFVGDCPEAILPDTEHVVIQAPVSSSDSVVIARARAVTGEPWVLRFTDTAGTDLGSSTLTTWRPIVDGTWDGVMHLEVQYDSTNDLWARHQSREWFRSGQTLEQYNVTLDRPWRNTTDTGMAFRIYQPEFFTRDNVLEVLAPGDIYDSTRQQVWPIDTAGSFRQGLRDFRRETTSRPSRMWRERRFQLPAPTLTPTTAAGGVGTWLGPVQEGTFTFCHTYAWGRRDIQWQQASYSQVIDPQWESAPSPASASFAHSSNNGRSIVLAGTAIDAMRNFDVAGTTREGQSGYRIRWYAARTATRTAGAGSAEYNQVETDGRYYLLAETEPTATVGTTTPAYTWTGATIPDYSRPLQHSTGYFGWSLYPHQDQRYEIDFRVLRMPVDLVSDQDVLPIEKDALVAFVQLVLHYLCLFDGVDQVDAKIHLDRYREMLAPLVRKRYANQGRVIEPRPIGGFRLTRRYGTYTEEV